MFAVTPFENGVISYGGQTDVDKVVEQLAFENGVISYGGQTGLKTENELNGVLRV